MDFIWLGLRCPSWKAESVQVTYRHILFRETLLPYFSRVCLSGKLFNAFGHFIVIWHMLVISPHTAIISGRNYWVGPGRIIGSLYAQIIKWQSINFYEQEVVSIRRGWSNGAKANITPMSQVWGNTAGCGFPQLVLRRLGRHRAMDVATHKSF